MMKRLLALLAVLVSLASTPCFAQSTQNVLQSGTVTAGHVPVWVYSNIIGDGGSANNGAISNFGLTANGAGTGPIGTNFCDQDAPISSPTGYHFLCFSPNALGGGLIAYGANGGATALPLQCDINGAISPCLGSQAQGMPTVLNLSTLEATASTTAVAVVRLAYSTNGDAPSLVYYASPSACSLNSGAGDNGSQVPSSDSNCWIALFPPGGADIREFGAVGDGSTDSHVAINSAAAYSVSSGACVAVPALTFYSTTTLTFGKAAVCGEALILPSNPSSGPEFLCPATLGAACVTFGVTGTSDAGGGMHDIIAAFSGTPQSGDQALVIYGYNTTCYDLLAKNAYDEITFSGTSTVGISSHCSKLFGYGATHDHLVINSMPEVYITDARFGINGTGDAATTNAYIGFTGHDPNTFSCVNCQFNQSSGTLSYFMDFFSLTSQPNGVYKVTASHIEDVATDIIHSDGTGTCLRCIFVSDTFNDTGAEFWALNGGGVPDGTIISNDNIYVASFTMPTVQYTHFILANDWISGTLTVNSSSNSVATISNVIADGNVTIEGGWGMLTLSNIRSQATYSDATATGLILASGTQPQAWTPVINFGGGAATEWTYTASGLAHRNPDGSFSATFGLSITAKGIATGAMTVTGLPYTCKTNYGLGGGYGDANSAPLYISGLQSLTSTGTAFANQGATTILLDESGATGLAAITDANFASSPTSVISGTVTCPAS